MLIALCFAILHFLWIKSKINGFTLLVLRQKGIEKHPIDTR